MGARADLVGILERAYNLDEPDDRWLRGICEAADPHFNHGRGVYAYCFDSRRAEEFSVWGFVSLDHTPVVPTQVVEWHRALGAEGVRFLYWRSGTFGTISERLRADAAHRMMQRFCTRAGVFDQLVLRTIQPDRSGVALCGPLPRIDARARGEERRWSRIAAHVAAGFRLRRALGEDAATTEGAEAILHPDGRCEHAEGVARDRRAREALREAAKRVDAARGRMRRDDPDLAIEVWRGLVRGRWSLVDHFESDGRRYILARPNPAAAPDPRALSRQERRIASYVSLGMSNKEIAYSMGLTESTVASHVASAARKLGVQSRVRLAHLVQALGADECDRDDTTS